MKALTLWQPWASLIAVGVKAIETRSWPAPAALVVWAPCEHGGIEPIDVSDQQPYGDFAPGRWAWLLDHVEQLPQPVPAKGRQGVWNWDGT